MAEFTEVKARSTIKHEKQLGASQASLLPDNFLVPAIMNHPVDLRGLSSKERQALLDGPKIDVFLKKIFVARVYKRVFIAASGKANTIITTNPLAKELNFPENLGDFHALRDVLNWMNAHYLGGEKIRMLPTSQNFVHMIKVYGAARALDMGIYFKHYSAVLHQRISNQNTIYGYEEVSAFQQFVHIDDPLAKHLVSDLAYRRYTNTIPDVDDFAAYLNRHPGLAKAMDAIDRKHEEQRKARAAEKQARTAEQNSWEKEAKAPTAEEAFRAQLQAARGGRPGGYGMGV